MGCDLKYIGTVPCNNPAQNSYNHTTKEMNGFQDKLVVEYVIYKQLITPTSIAPRVGSVSSRYFVLILLSKAATYQKK